jgi:hypothetical protein
MTPRTRDGKYAHEQTSVTTMVELRAETCIYCFFRSG